MMQVKPNNRNSYPNSMEIPQERPPLPPRGPPLVLNHYRQQGSLDGYGPYSSVPAPKPVGRSSTVTPPPYRMPPHPLPPLPPLPGAVTEQPPPSSPAYHTHSNKFPIERELVLSSSDKNNKIPILSEYNKRPRSIVPEGPVKQVAWERESQYQQAFNQEIVQSPLDGDNSYVSFADPHNRHSVDLERGIRDGNDKTKISKTYYSIKDMISNRFSKSRENVADHKLMNNQSVDSLAGPMQAVSLGPRPQRPNPPLPVLQSPKTRPQFVDAPSPLLFSPSCEVLSPGTHPNFSPSAEVLSPVPPSTPLSVQQQERRLSQQRNDSHGIYATARAYVVQARPPAQRRPVRTAGPSELSHSSPNLTANLESNGVYISKTPGKYPPPAPHPGSESDDDGGFKKAPPLPDNRPQLESPSEEPPPITQDQKIEATPQTEKVSSATSSDYEKATRGSSVGDSGRGSAAYSSGRAGSAELARNHDPGPPQPEPQRFTPNHQRGKEWVDMVESELRQILDPNTPSGACSSTLSDSVSSLTPPLPPLSPGGGSSPTPTPRHTRYKNTSLPVGARPDYDKDDRKYGSNIKNQRTSVARREWSRNTKSTDARSRQSNSSKSKIPQGLLNIETDLGSTTTGPLDSVLDSRLSVHSSDEDMSTTIDANDAMAIRRQLHGLENMYSEVLKLLGVKKYGAARYPGSDARAKRRYGSMSSLPSSVSSRPVRDKRRDDRKKVRDIKGINKRFQRLESHVVTLARSVAHLSSEMRTQHLMIQEMENIRGEMAQLRAQSGGNRSMSVPRALNSLMSTGEPRDPQALTNPSRVKKLTKFFGDEPPLLRIFLKRLGYEKYASTFETERIGMVELPYLTEERLQKMGIPMGPRLRILQEAQISFCRDSVYVV